MEAVIFYMLAGVALFTALAAITRRSPIGSAFMLIACLLAVAGLFGMLGAPFVAALQVLIAAGAVMVLFIFVLMLVDLGSESKRKRVMSFARVVGAVASGYLTLILALSIWRPPFMEAPESGASYEATSTLAALMTGRYAVPFELTGAMLLVAAVGAIALAKKDADR